MKHEAIPLSAVVAGNALLDQGIIPGADPEEVEQHGSVNQIQGILSSVGEQAQALNIDDERKDRVSENALRRLEEQTSGLIRAEELIRQARRIRAMRQLRSEAYREPTSRRSVVKPQVSVHYIREHFDSEDR